MNLKNILEVNTAEIIENILQIKLKDMENTYYIQNGSIQKSLQLFLFAFYLDKSYTYKPFPLLPPHLFNILLRHL